MVFLDSTILRHFAHHLFPNSLSRNFMYALRFDDGGEFCGATVRVSGRGGGEDDEGTVISPLHAGQFVPTPRALSSIKMCCPQCEHEKLMSLMVVVHFSSGCASWPNDSSSATGSRSQRIDAAVSCSLNITSMGITSSPNSRQRLRIQVAIRLV